MLKAEAGNKICCEMNSNGTAGSLLFLSVEILWNLLENCREEATEQLCSIDCVK